jgi:hypothetical protein
MSGNKTAFFDPLNSSRTTIGQPEPMTRSRKLLGTGAFVTTFLLVAIVGAGAAKAGPVYVWMHVDPASTAGARVSAVDGMTVTSTRSGVGTWHLYAVDDVTGSFGIRNYSITLSGVTEINHRSPTGTYRDFYGDPQSVGFNDLRSAADINPIVAGQALTNATQVGGFGQTANNFSAKIVNEVSVTQISSGQWGTYGDNVYLTGVGTVVSQAPIGLSGALRSALFLAEGTGDIPSVSAASISVWTNAALTTSAVATSYTLNVNPFCLGCFPLVLDAVINNVNANVPGSVTHTFSAYGSSTITWSDFQFESYTPAFGGSGTGATNPAAFDPSTRQFTWNSVGSPIGIYKWNVTATNFLGSDQGTLTVNVTIPEPATALLAGLLAIALGCYRRQPLGLVVRRR